MAEMNADQESHTDQGHGNADHGGMGSSDGDDDHGRDGGHGGRDDDD